MCPTFMNLEYIENENRYDTETHKMLKQFLLTGSLKGIIFNKIISSEYNICFYNKTRQHINYLCNKNKKGEQITFLYQNKNETYKVYEGIRLICTKNLNEYKMYNNETYILDKIADDGKGYTINDKIFTKDELSAYFICCLLYNYS